MHTSLELFAGAGGIAIGLEQAGFESIGLVEFDKHASNTLKLNRPNWNVYFEDVALFADRDLESELNIKQYELDLLSGGSPCQSFSVAGKKLGFEDTRGTMFYHYAKVLHKLKPKMFLFENVRGLLNHDKGKTFSVIRSVFEQEGYELVYEVLNSWDYNVPQKRERLITIGVRKDFMKEPFTFPEKDPTRPVVGDIKLDVNPSNLECNFYSERRKELFELVPQGGYWKDIDPKLAQEYLGALWNGNGGSTGCLHKLSLSEPCRTILTSPSMKTTERCHPLETRPLSIRETARIQTFPEDWEFCGGKGARYKQIGNAVPINLAKAIGESIIKYLER